MIETRAAYKGYVVNARPHQLADDGRWSTDLVIERHFGSGVDVVPFYGELTFETADEAIQHCLGLGAQIIDGVYQIGRASCRERV